ncbi:MAG: hypothetical protein F4Y44_05590 [Chloroflexi bacterium]|nr:hypothetical protein [Chloroflexota bacterium]
MDTLSAQTTLMPHIITSARIKGMMSIMIDRSDLDSGINRLFAAVCFRQRELPLLSRVSRPEELNPSQNRLEEIFIRRPVTHLPTTVRPLILADRGFGRESLLLFMQRLPTLTRCLVDYVGRLKCDVIVRTDDFRGRLRGHPLRKNRTATTSLVLFRGAQHAQT